MPWCLENIDDILQMTFSIFFLESIEILLEYVPKRSIDNNQLIFGSDKCLQPNRHWTIT